MKLERHDPERFYRDGSRFYRTPDGELPGVTTILGATKSPEDRASLERWRRRVGEHEARRIGKVARHRGTILHEQVEAYLLRGEEGPWLDSYWSSIEPVLRQVDDVHLIEGAVWHPDGWAGTVDCVARLRGELVVLDWKTSDKWKKREYVGDYLLQAGVAYPRAAEHVYPEVGRLPGVVVVALGSGKPAQVFRVEPADGERDFEWAARVASSRIVL